MYRTQSTTGCIQTANSNKKIRSLDIRKMQVKVTMRYGCILNRGAK